VRLTRVKRFLLVVAVIGLPLFVAACKAASNEAVEVSKSPSAVPPSSGPTTRTTKAAVGPMPCNPGSGFPVRKDGCPDPEPETGWLIATEGLNLAPFRTFGNDAEGEAYARKHGEEYPFSNDYFDAPNGASHPLEFTHGTVCTGIILVGYREPLTDHVVSCRELMKVAERRRIPVAVWFSGGKVIQASELYRP
jgi:hypothetical protein